MSGEEGNISSEAGEGPIRKNHNGGKFNRFEPLSIVDITSSPIVLTWFQNVGCYQFCEKVKKVHSRPEIMRLFVLNLHNKHVNITGIDFELSSDTISHATGLIDVGEKWFRRAKLDMTYYEPFIKPRYKEGSKRIFPFSHLLEKYEPLMRVIMKYFTCERRYSRL